MKSADIFVYYDDVTFIKQGWINRNRIILNGKEYMFTLELKGASSFKEINKIEIGKNRNKLLKTFQYAYKNAPFYSNLEPLLNSIFISSQNNLSQFIIETTKLIIDYLDINTKLLRSSEIKKNNALKGQDKVIEICKMLGATKYINLPGGKDLYSKERFLGHGIELYFIRPGKIEYRQYGNEFIQWLSIIDIMMFNPINDIHRMLDNYELE
jgi:hypothetical protein